MGRSAKTPIWIPGEEHEDGLIVTDAATGEEVLVTEGRIAKIDMPTSSGKIVHPKAVRGELLGTDGKFARAKLASGKVVRTRILFGWQLSEDGKQPAAEIADRPLELEVESAA